MSWLPSWIWKKKRERELDAELRFHLEQQAQEKIATGADAAEARRQAALEFGGLDQIKEDCRSVRGGQWIEDTFRDLRYGLRSLFRSPGFTVIALVTIALGVGANSFIFTFVNGVMLKPLPFPNADRMALIRETYNGATGRKMSPADYLDYCRDNTVFETLAANMSDRVTVTGVDEPIEVSVGSVTPNYFRVYGYRAILGRIFAPDEDKSGKDRVALISHALWVTLFAADPKVVGKTVKLNGDAYTIIGVLQAGVADRTPSQIWCPMRFNASVATRDWHWLGCWGLLKRGVKVQQARAEISTIAWRLARDYPKSNKGWGAELYMYSDTTAYEKNVNHSLWALMAAVAMVLLIGCANLANLTLARGSSRDREVAIRAALGADRSRLIRQFLTECVLLSTAGGALGFAGAYLGMTILRQSKALYWVPAVADLSLDYRVVLFGLGLSVFTGFIFGLVPALKASRPDLTRAIKEGGPATSAGRTLKELRSYLIVAEVAMAFVLLTGAGLLIRSFIKMEDLDMGFSAENVITARLPFPDRRLFDPSELAPYLHRLQDRIKSVPGVREVALASGLPLQGWGIGLYFHVAGSKADDMAHRPECFLKTVTPSYFKALAIHLNAGRLLRDSDVKGSMPVAVINETLARKFFPAGNPIGRYLLVPTLRYDSARFGPDQAWQIVGVIHDERVGGREINGEESPGIYVTEEQCLTPSQCLVVRGTAKPEVLQNSIRAAVREINRDQVLDQFQTLEEIKASSIAYERFRLELLTLFALVALLLSTVGFYGVISYTVAQRTQELGIRAALGARPRAIMEFVFRDGIALTVIGLAIGLVGAFGLARFLSFMLFGVEQNDALTLVCVGMVLFSTALLACYIPARRAARISPAIALKCE